MIKVMHLMSTHAFSGAENVACQIINCFKKDESYKMVYVSEIKENKSNLDDRNIKYYELNKFNYKNVKKTVEELKPDIIHAHDIKASIIASLFSKKAKVISHVHANHENMRKAGAKTIIYNIFSKRMTKIIWVSQSALDNYKFKNNIIDKSIVLYNVIDSNEIYEKIKLDKKEYSNYDLIFLGRMTFQKDPIRFINLVKEVCNKNKKIKIAMVGSGELDEEVKKIIKENKLNDNIDFFGFVNNPYKILYSANIMVMTSRYEGTPMSALEAFSLGKPIIATPTDGLVKIIENNKTGYISDNDNEIIDKIILLTKDKNKLKEMSENVLKESEKINNIEKYKVDIESVYGLKK